MTPMSSETPRIESFVLRFVADSPAGVADPIPGSPSFSPAASNLTPPALDEPVEPVAPSPARWHGVIVHVQTHEEKTFTSFADAIAFIERYVPVREVLLPKEDDKTIPSTQVEKT
jgi:hypothetical protein